MKYFKFKLINFLLRIIKKENMVKALLRWNNKLVTGNRR